MPILAFDPVSGASGNMILGALLDLGASLEHIRGAVEAAGLSGVEFVWNPEDEQCGLRCAYFDVRIDDHEPHPHRGLSDIFEIIERADAPVRAKERARAVFRRLAEAEARIHGASVEEVHFHEVGAEDAVIDILGTCIALEDLGIDRIVSGPLKFGRGSVKCAHGTLPAPAPATVELAGGFPAETVDVEAELTTPTGAALITTLAEGAWGGVQARLLKCGVARGSRILPDRPNIFRALLFEQESTDALLEAVDVIETDVDDQTPEVTGVLCDHLRSAGALDVAVTPVFMKKNRPGVRLTVISKPSDAPHLIRILFRESTTIGVRCHRVQRYALPRSATCVQTRFGPVRAKRIFRPDREEITPELDDARLLAEKRNVPLRDVLREASSSEPRHADSGEPDQ